MKKRAKKIVRQENTRSVTSSTSTEPIFRYWAWIFLAWTLYRYFFQLPETVDEFVAKPLVFTLPLLWYVTNKEHLSLSSIGLHADHIKEGITGGLIVGGALVIEGLILNLLKYGAITIHSIDAVTTYGLGGLAILTLVTSFTEELLCRGFLYDRLNRVIKSSFASALISALLFTAYHLPILVMMHKFTGTTLVIFLSSTMILGTINGIVYGQSKSLTGPILVHFLWNMAVSLLL
jgi:membrane protease YdiL (CAAX protease family)